MPALTFIINRVEVFVVTDAVKARVHLLPRAGVILRSAAVRGQVYAGQGAMSPATGASWPIKIPLVTNADAVHVVKVTVRQSAKE